METSFQLLCKIQPVQIGVRAAQGLTGAAHRTESSIVSILNTARSLRKIMGISGNIDPTNAACRNEHLAPRDGDFRPKDLGWFTCEL